MEFSQLTNKQQTMHILLVRSIIQHFTQNLQNGSLIPPDEKFVGKSPKLFYQGGSLIPPSAIVVGKNPTTAQGNYRTGEQARYICYSFLRHFNNIRMEMITFMDKCFYCIR